MRYVLMLAGAAALGYAVYRTVAGSSEATDVRKRLVQMSAKEAEQVRRLESAHREFEVR